MSPGWATAMPTVVVILELKRPEALLAIGCRCDSQNQAATETRTRNASPPIQRISFRLRPDLGGCCVISNKRYTSVARFAARQMASFQCLSVPHFVWGLWN